MPKVSDSHLEERRQQILGAASSCFARNGFHQATMHDVSQEAGLSAGAVYRYFRSKDEIISAMSSAGRQRMLDLIEAAKAKGSTKEVLDHLADAFLPSVDKPDSLCDLAITVQLWGEALRNPAIMAMLQERFDLVRGSFAEIIVQAQRRGEISRSLNADSIARLLIAIYHGLLLQAALGTKPDTSRYAEAAKRMLSGLFQPQPAKRPSSAAARSAAL